MPNSDKIQREPLSLTV